MKEIPVIDVAGLRSASPDDRKAVAHALGAACREVGFFYVVGHGIPRRLLDDAFEASRTFFALPVEAKERFSITTSPHNRGYVALEGERLDEDKPADLKEAFNIGLDLAPDDPEILAGAPMRGVNLWPDLPGWRDTLLEYYDAAWNLGRLLHRGLALDLGVSEDFFEDKLDAPMATLRLLHYPPRRSISAEGQTGAGEHTDYGNLTILATDGIAGLEVRTRDGRWLDAPAIDGAFVCNIGDCLMRWTNDTYVSTPHRVRMPETDRYSIAFFLDANPDAEVRVLEPCTDAARPAKYPPVTAGAYLRARLDATYDFRAPAALVTPPSGAAR